MTDEASADNGDVDEDLNDIAAALDLLNVGETERDHRFDADGEESIETIHDRLMVDAFHADETKDVEVSPDGRELRVETERFVAVGHLDETADSLRVVSGFIERDVEGEPYLLLEMEDDAHEMLSERGDARQQFYDWQQAEPAGAAALTAAERNPRL